MSEIAKDGWCNVVVEGITYKVRRLEHRPDLIEFVYKSEGYDGPIAIDGKMSKKAPVTKGEWHEVTNDD
jgi:hypothetical protein